MFGRKSENGYTETLDGIRIKTLVYGEHTLMTEFVLSKDALLPEHAHGNEQTGYLVTGKIRLHIEGRSLIINPGDSWCIPSNSRHKADILEDSVAIEIFTPCRDEYKQYVFPEDIQ